MAGDWRKAGAEYESKADNQRGACSETPPEQGVYLSRLRTHDITFYVVLWKVMIWLLLVLFFFYWVSFQLLLG